jgi:hypothetical protein
VTVAVNAPTVGSLFTGYGGLDHALTDAIGPTRLARFVEHLMGCADGWVCDVPGLSRNDKIRLLGNGVVRQQGAAAIRHLLQLIDQLRAVA